MSLVDDSEDDEAELTFEPCRDECCKRIGVHARHDVEDNRGVRPETEVCSKCLDLVKGLGSTCSCGALTLLAPAEPRRRKSMAGHVQRGDGSGLCRWTRQGDEPALTLAAVTCRACLKALQTAVKCPQEHGPGACELCLGAGWVKRIDLFKRGLAL